MPTNRLPEFIAHLKKLESKVDDHLKDGIGVLTKIARLEERSEYHGLLLKIILGGVIVNILAILFRK